MPEVWVIAIQPNWDPGSVVAVAADEHAAKRVAETEFRRYYMGLFHREPAPIKWVPPLWDDTEPREGRALNIDESDWYITPFEVQS